MKKHLPAQLPSPLIAATVFCLLFNMPRSEAQNQEAWPKEITFTATGTGRTTGHIANLSIVNPSKKPIVLELGPFYIPSSGQYQPYLVPAIPPVTVPPESNIRVPIEGYCTDIHLPPVPSESGMPPVSSWIKPGSLPEGWAPNPENGWIPTTTESSVPNSGGTGVRDPVPVVLLPGENTPLGYTIDVPRHPEEAAPILLDVIGRISRAYDAMKQDMLITTPFSKAPSKERESVIQQTFWIYSAGLSGEVYQKEDFTKVTIEQFETNTGREFNTVPPAAKENILQGVDDFWNTFEAVGANAKVLSKPQADPRTIQEQETPPPSSVPETQPAPCSCGEAQITLPLRIETGDNKLISGDSIGWHVGRLNFLPPRVNCPCPEHCPKTCKAEIEFTPYYRWLPHTKPMHGQSSGKSEQMQTFQAIRGKGYVDIATTITNTCGSANCPQTLTRRLYLTESNDCCDRIRANTQSGKLRFSLGNDGHVEVDGRQIILNLNNPDVIRTYQADFNIEAIFCNLKEDEIFANLLSEAGQQTGANGVREASMVRDVSMDFSGGGDGNRPHYVLSFQQANNSDEFSFVISMDKETCNFDVQVLFRGKIYEAAGRPDLGLLQLQAFINANSNTLAPAYWNNAFQYLLQLIKHEYHNTPPGNGLSTQSVSAALITQLQGAVAVALAQNPPPQVRDKLNDLRAALGTGDLGRIGIALGRLTGTQGLR